MATGFDGLLVACRCKLFIGKGLRHCSAIGALFAFLSVGSVKRRR
jgi:hypothetical protein